jgi:hypothetical protein
MTTERFKKVFVIKSPCKSNILKEVMFPTENDYYIVSSSQEGGGGL